MRRIPACLLEFENSISTFGIWVKRALVKRKIYTVRRGDSEHVGQVGTKFYSQEGFR